MGSSASPLGWWRQVLVGMPFFLAKNGLKHISRISVVALAVGIARAQAPLVPIDQYGPPTCSAAAKPPMREDESAIERATSEQREGERDPRAVPSAEPMENFAIARYRLIGYGDCTGDNGCYWADLDAQYRRAEGALRVELAQHKPGDKLAIVMDIDETSLSNYCEMRREDFGYIAMLYRKWETGASSATAIPGARRLFDEARAAGVSVFFITGRAGVPGPGAASPIEDETAATARNLRAAGFSGWTGLVLRDGAENGMPTIQYKSGERRKIASQGYTIVLSVGDQWSDLLGKPQAEVSVKLPNPFYFLP